jgi:tetratricopeptide (TPR) repeat protein
LPGATATCARALDMARAASHRPSEAHALTVAARLSLARGQYDAALQHSRAALAISSELDLRLTQARSLWALSETLYATDNPAAAAPLRQQAVELLQAAGASSVAWN